MTTIIPFVPSGQAPNPPFSFQATLDGSSYNCAVSQLYFGQRYYLTIKDGDGNLIINEPLIGSPTGLDLATLAWSQGPQTVLATTQEPHGYPAGSVRQLTLSGCAPAAFNGTFECVITGPSSFTYPMASNPGAATLVGVVSYDIDLVGALFDSTMVFREQSMQFEISP